MSKKGFDDEFKEKVVKECQETGNVAMVARRYEISPNTVRTWVRRYQERGTVKPMPQSKEKRLKALENQLKEVSQENDQLKRLLAEKELEVSILKDLRDAENPQ